MKKTKFLNLSNRLIALPDAYKEISFEETPVLQ